MSQNLIQYELMLFSDHDITKIYMACNLVFDYENLFGLESIHFIASTSVYFSFQINIFGKNIQR